MNVKLFLLLAVAAVSPATWIGWKVKGRPLTGFLLGVFLNWPGAVIIALMPPTAEMRVRRSMRDMAVAEEARRRRGGAEPWTAP